jgi:transposase
VRWILCEAAQTAKRSPQFAASYQAIARRRGKKIATTAIARKLLTRAYHLLTDATSSGGTKPGGDRQAPGELAFSHEPAKPRSMT